MKTRIISIIALLLCSVISAYSQKSQQLLLRQPTMNKTHIVFSHAGDLWIVPKEGGDAQRLTTGTGNERSPVFSPDGKTIAFTGEYDGNVDVYTVPATGGVPKRLTWHPGSDSVVAWTVDSKQVMFNSMRASDYSRYLRLFTIPVDGVFPQEVPLPMGNEGSYSPDGKRLAYTPLSKAFTAWKRYRGGRTSAIWIANLADSSVEKLPRDNSNDFNPMWSVSNPDKIYFLSDRNGPITLFVYDVKSKKISRIIENNGLDIKSAYINSDDIVYEQFGTVNLYDLKSGKSKKVDINVSGDIATVRPRYEKVGSRISNVALSPTGARAIFEARGEILTVPAEKGDIRNLSNTSGIAERDPAWSSDGKWVAYFSDEGGEYSLHLQDQKGAGQVKKIKLSDKPTFYFAPRWSPDSKKIAYQDKALNIWYVDIEKGVPVKIDSLRMRTRSASYSWSSDSRWITYARQMQSWYNAVFIYSLEEAKSRQITDGMSDADTPVFDKNGKYLYFTASTDIGPNMYFLDMSSLPHKASRSIYACVLRKDLPSPLAPESDEEKIAEEKKVEEGKDAPKAADKPADKDKPANKDTQIVNIDFDNIDQRIVALPIPNQTYSGIEPGKAGTIYIVEYTGGGLPLFGGGAVTIHKYDLEKRKFEKVLDSVTGFKVSSNGEKMLYSQQQNWFIAPTATPVKPGEGKIKTEEMQVLVDPVAEWKQIYDEVWRLERDFFYDPNLHGLNLQATSQKYKPYLESITHRDDLNYLFDEMLGELSVGHLYVRGGDIPQPNKVSGGLLGADYKVENGRYRISKIYRGENWTPQAQAPLTQPGVNVSEGDYLLAVNGRNLTSNDNIYSFFESTAKKQTVIKVGPNPDGTNSRDVVVIPVESDNGLRNLAWIEGNRRKVNQMSGGKLAYVYLPDTGGAGYSNFNRYYFSQIDRDGAIIDERFNGGGLVADYIADNLKKTPMSYWALRDGNDLKSPYGAMQGPKVMIVNEMAGSGGDYLPYLFRRMNIGTIVGKRTWGGLVGIFNFPLLIDGGSVTAPNLAFYTTEGKWDIENIGVAPDIEVELDPKAWREGHDLQLEKAVEILMDSLIKNPIKQIQRPPYPNYHNGKP